MTLPTLGPLTTAALLRFDVTTGMPVAFRVLRRRLGWGRAVRASGTLLRRSGRDPLAGLPAGCFSPRDEQLTRHQLRSAVLLDDVLRHDLALGDEERLSVLSEVVAQTGARFVARFVPNVRLEQWRQASTDEREGFLRQLLDRFFNMRAESLHTDEATLGFDVTSCRFVELCHALDRPYLAPMFCEADSVRFAEPDSLVSLRRTGTLATGAPCCDFRFTVR